MGCGASAEGGQGGAGNEDLDSQYEEENNCIYDDMEKKPKDENDGDLFGVAENESNEQFMATKPWIGALKEPSEPPEVDMENAPEKSLELAYVNGYRCEDSRQNLFYTAEEDQIVYMSAAIGVVQGITDNTQTYFGAGLVGEVVGHNDDIEALHVNPERTICATGQRGKNPSIFVWDIQTKEVICTMKQGRNSRAVRQLRFTPDGKSIITCDISNDHVLHIFDAATGAKQASQKTGNDVVYDMDTGSGQYVGALATKRGIRFVNWSGGAGVEIKRGFGCQDFMVSCTFFPDGNTLAAGNTKGTVHIFQGNQSRKKIPMHSGGIHAICIKEDKMITSGYRDHTLKVFDASSYQEQDAFPVEGDYARSLDFRNGKILMGTRDGQIVEIDLNTETKDRKLIVNGHGTGEAWGLSIAPEGNIITTGDDNKIVNFCPEKDQTISTGIVNEKKGKKHRIGGASTLSRFPPNQCSRSVAVHPTNGHVAVATNEGELSIRESKDALNNFIVGTKKIDREWTEVMAYSPDGKYLAVGTHSRNIWFLDVENGYNSVGKATAHNAAILNIDWTLDSSAIRSVCNAYELLFFGNDGTQMPDGASAFRDEEYATQTCKLGWWVQGIFPPATDGSHINGVARNNGKDLIATGDDWGFVNLYKNPNVKGSKFKSYRAHSSHVVRVQFNADDSYLYSIGGYDRCLMKWRLV